MRHLELFAGIGGFRTAIDLLAKDCGFPSDCIGYSEIDTCAKRTYNSCHNPTGGNAENDLGDIVSFTSDKELIEKIPDFTLLTGGFPCQAFSMMGKQGGFEDERGNLFFNIIKIIKIKKPCFILLENVKNLINHDRGRTFSTIIRKLDAAGYRVYFDIFNTANFALAQTRNRVFIFGVRKDIKNKFEFSESSVKQDFESVKHKTSLCIQRNVLDVLQRKVSEKYYLSDRIKPTLLSNGTGGFVSKSEIDQLIARPLTATMMKMHRACQDNYYSDNFILSHGEWNSSNISKEELAKERIRRITPSEALALQGFPNYFIARAISQGMADGHLYKQAGNAVSVNSVYAVLRYILRFYPEVIE